MSRNLLLKLPCMDLVKDAWKMIQDKLTTPDLSLVKEERLEEDMEKKAIMEEIEGEEEVI